MKIIDIAYILATIISLAAGAPQIRQLIIEKRSDELSLTSWSIWIVTQTVSLLYAISIHNPLMVAVNISLVAFYAFMTLLILKYRKVPVVEVAEDDQIEMRPVN